MSIRRRSARFFVLVFCIFAATACAAIRGAPEAPRPATKAQSDPAYLIEAAVLADYLGPRTPEDKRTRRNEIIDERILEIDTQYRRYEDEMWRGRVGGNIAVDWALLALSGAGATIGGEELKTVLAATSTGVIGARESFDKQAFFDATLPALFAQMIAEQAKVKALIAEKKLLSAADYTIYAAQSDLWNLVRAGTIRGILHAIALDAGAKEEDAQEKEADVQLKIVRDKTFDIALTPRVDRLKQRIRALDVSKAMELASNLPIESDSGSAAVENNFDADFASDEDSVKDALEYFVSFMNRTEENVSAFEAALEELGS